MAAPHEHTPQASQQKMERQPLNRRRALGVLSALAAAAGAAALSTTRPEQAGAVDNLGNFTSSTGTTVVTADNTGGGRAVSATNNGTTATVFAKNTGTGQAFDGSTANGIAVRGGNNSMFAAILGENDGTGPAVRGLTSGGTPVVGDLQPNSGVSNAFPAVQGNNIMGGTGSGV
jgi:hypothetical protein